MLDFANDPNGTVGNGVFNTINVFTKRTKTPPKIGDIYDIDIVGPDNGSVALVALSSGFGATTGDCWLDVQTVSCDRYGTHPESGAREFGMQYVKDGVMFYTRGVSRGNFLSRYVGVIPQRLGWMSMMKGIMESIRRQGGTPKEKSISARADHRV